MATIDIQQTYIKSREEQGYRRLFIWLNRDAAEALKRLTEHLDKSQGRLIEELLLYADQALTSRHQSPKAVLP